MSSFPIRSQRVLIFNRSSVSLPDEGFLKAQPTLIVWENIWQAKWKEPNDIMFIAGRPWHAWHDIMIIAYLIKYCDMTGDWPGLPSP